MSRADYAHWNEEADMVWWQEEGRHADEPREYDPSDAEMDAVDAFYEEVGEMGVEEIQRMLCDADYRRKWPKAAEILATELRDRLAVA